MLRPLDIVIRAQTEEANKKVAAVGATAKATAVDIASVGNESKKTSSAVEKIDDKGALKRVKSDAKAATEETNRLADGAESVNEKLDKVRNVGLGIGAAGVGALMFARYLSTVASEGDGVIQRLQSILKQQGRLADMNEILAATGDIATRGHFADDDDLNEAAVRVASFSVQTAHMAEMLELAARQARTMRGELLNTSDAAEALAKAYATGQVSQLKKQGVTITDEEIDKIEKAYDISQKIGQAEFMNTLGNAIRANTVILEDSLTDAQAAANDAAREMDNLQTSLGQGVQQGEKNLAGVTARLLQIINLSPQAAQGLGQVGYYAGLGAASFGGLLAAGAQTWAGLVQVAAYYGVTVGGLFSTTFWAARWATFAAMGVSAWTAISTAAVTAGAASWAAIAPLLPLILAIGTAALVTAGAMYVLTGAKDAIDQAAKDSAQADAADKEFYDQQVKKGRFTGSFEDWQKSMGRGQENSEDTENGSDPATDIIKAKKDLESVNTGGFGSMPSIPMALMPSGVSPYSFSPSSTGANSFPTGDVPSQDAFLLQIRTLEDSIATETNKAKKEKLQSDLKVLKRAQQDAKRAAAEAKTAEGLQNKAEGYELDVTRNRARLASNSKLDELQLQLDKAKDDKDAAMVQSLTVQIETEKANRDFAVMQEQSAKEAITDIKKANSTLQIANDNRADALKRAVTTGRRAAANVKADKNKGDGDAGIRALLAFQRGAQIGGSMSGFGFPALNPSGALSGGSGGAGGNPSVNQSGISQQSDGSYRATIEVVVPRQGLGILKGRR